MDFYNNFSHDFSKSSRMIRIISNHTMETTDPGLLKSGLEARETEIPLLLTDINEETRLIYFYIFISKDFKNLVLSFSRFSLALSLKDNDYEKELRSMSFSRKISIKNRDIVSSISTTIEVDFMNELKKHVPKIKSIKFIGDLYFGLFAGLLKKCFIRRFAISINNTRYSVKMLYSPQDSSFYSLWIDDILFFVNRDYHSIQNELNYIFDGQIHLLHSRKELMYGFEKTIPEAEQKPADQDITAMGQSLL